MTRVFSPSRLVLVCQSKPTPSASQAGALLPLRFWIIFFSTLDILLTYIILSEFEHLGGREANYFALAIIERFGFTGAIVLKVCGVATALGACACITRTQPATARKVERILVGIAALPVLMAVACFLTTILEHK